MPRLSATDEPTSAAGGTRARIQQVALELFTDQGYEATSLREIAERLGVTKAALYYHFKTKDEIVQSLLHDQAAMLDALIEWGRQQPRTIETRREFIRRYATMLFDRVNYSRFMRFLERNQSSAQKLHAGAAMRERLAAVQSILSPPDTPLTVRVRRAAAVLTLHTSWFTLRAPEVSDEERRAAAVEVALELVE
jgi:AcrR family transcriptional regulator